MSGNTDTNRSDEAAETARGWLVLYVDNLRLPVDWQDNIGQELEEALLNVLQDNDPTDTFSHGLPNPTKTTRDVRVESHTELDDDWASRETVEVGSTPSIVVESGRVALWAHELELPKDVAVRAAVVCEIQNTLRNMLHEYEDEVSFHPDLPTPAKTPDEVTIESQTELDRKERMEH